MCGIAGILGSKSSEQALHDLRLMTDAIAHRGPDGEGQWECENGSIALGHRRLAIIDPQARANQPMLSKDDRFALTFNGEIYNHEALRAELSRLGSSFSTTSDTEVVFEAYRQWGTACFSRFRGMWAFALVDRVERKLVLSRDPFGIKPLYVGSLGGRFFFASEPKAFLAAEDGFREKDDVSVALFLDIGIVDRGPWTFFQRIRRFPHAHYSVVSLANPSDLKFERYWHPPAQLRDVTYEEAVHETQRRFQASVALHMVSDVPVAVCLSGGLDSSAIASTMRRSLPKQSSVTAFSVGFPTHSSIDETKWAKEVASAHGLEHIIAPQSHLDLGDLFGRVVKAQDEPFGSTSIFAQYNLFEVVHQHGFKVVLDGQGADEQLAGYHGLFGSFLDSLARARQTATFFSEGFSLWKKHRFRFHDYLFRKGARRLVGPFRRKAAGVATSATLDEYQQRLAAIAFPESSSSFEELLVSMTCDTNLPALLRYEDRDSMAHSVESRVPFLETDFVGYVLSLPASFKVRKGVTKSVLRDAMVGFIPERVRQRRDKLGFTTPEAAWLKSAFGEQQGNVGWRQRMVDQWLKQYA